MKKKYYGNLKNRKQFLPLSYGKVFQNADLPLLHSNIFQNAVRSIRIKTD